MYYQNKIQEEKQNLKVMWDIFGTVINPKKMKQSSRINELLVKDKKITKRITDDQEISNSINSFFSNIGPDLANKHNTNPNAHNKYLNLLLTSVGFDLTGPVDVVVRCYRGLFLPSRPVSPRFQSLPCSPNCLCLLVCTWYTQEFVVHLAL